MKVLIQSVLSLLVLQHNAYCYDIQHSFSYSITAKDVAKLPLGQCNKKLLRNKKATLPTDLTFLAVDVKYDGSHLKILEFQDGPTAGLRSYDEVSGRKGDIWQVFWDYLATLSKPMWYVGIKPTEKGDTGFSHNDKDRVKFDEFLAMGGRYASSLEKLERDEAFIDLVKTSGNQELRKSHPAQLFANYKGIILQKLPKRKAMKSFKAKYPNFLLINQFTRQYLNNKQTTHRLFERLGLQKYRPWCKILPKRYFPSLASSIISEHKAPYYVIKPINSARSNGVIIVKKNKLGEVLKKILQRNRAIEFEGMGDRAYRPKEPLTFAYWKGDKEGNFIVEAYAPSKTISVAGELYDPTARMMFIVTHEGGNVTFTFLKSFWKLPPLPLRYILLDQHISKHRDDLAKLPLEEIVIAGDDLRNMERLALKALLPLYLGILAGK